jgi:hypothetical protein
MRSLILIVIEHELEKKVVFAVMHVARLGVGRLDDWKMYQDMVVFR